GRTGSHDLQTNGFSVAKQPRKQRTDMEFLQRLLGEFCPHRFTWPRLSGNGQQHYQICLICGTAYEYDWKWMQRTDRPLVTNGRHLLASAQTRLPGTVN